MIGFGGDDENDDDGDDVDIAFWLENEKGLKPLERIVE